MCFNLSLSIFFQVSKSREPNPGALRVLEPEAGFSLLQASPSRSRGELRGHHVFVMPRPICNYVHRIMLQFYVSFCIFFPHVVGCFFFVPLFV
jgi:hypothetical protein